MAGALSGFCLGLDPVQTKVAVIAIICKVSPLGVKL